MNLKKLVFFFFPLPGYGLILDGHRLADNFVSVLFLIFILEILTKLIFFFPVPPTCHGPIPDGRG